MNRAIKNFVINFPKYSPYISENTGTISKKIAGVFEDSRLEEVALKNNLQIIRKAIEANKGAGTKIAFHFNGYDENKKLKVRTDSDGNKLRYVANPYYIIMYNGKPYLICAVDPYDNVAIYRIDLMSDITTEIKPSLAKDGSMVSEKRRPKSEIKGLPMDWNLKEASKFQTEHLYMYYGKPESISLKIDKDRYTLLHDYFGDRYQFVEHIDDTWDYLTDKLFEVRKAIDMLFLGDKDMQAKLIRITDETEEFVRSYERPGVVTRWKRINPRILFFECAFDLMEECPDMYQQISWELTDLKLVCYPDESLIEARKRYFKEEKRKIEDGNLRYSEDRVFQNELLRTLKRVFEHDFREYL